MLISKLNLFLITLILIFIPLYPKFPLVGVSNTFVSIRLDDFAVALVLGLFVITHIKTRYTEFFRPLPRSIYLYLFVGFAALFSGVFLTKTAGLNLGLLHAARRIEYFCLFFVGYIGFKDIRDLPFVIRVVVITSFLVAIYGLGQQFLGWPIISTTNSEFAKGLAVSLGPAARINSTFAGHYDLAAYSVFPLLLILALLAQKPKRAWLLLGIGSVIYLALLLSASRTTFASFFLSAGLMILAIRKKWWLVPLSIVAVISFLASPQLRGRYFELVTSVHAQVDAEVPDALKPTAQPEDRSLSIRLQAEWPNAYRAILKNPVFGTGFSSVGLAVDNDYLRAMAETGILGFAAFGLIFIRFGKTSWKFFRRYQPDLPSAFIIAVTLSVLSLLANAVFIDVFEASKIAIFTWLVVGLAEKTKQLYET